MVNFTIFHFLILDIGIWYKHNTLETYYIQRVLKCLKLYIIVKINIRLKNYVQN